MKICSKCSISKNEREYFTKNKETGRLHAQCKMCYKEHRKSYYKDHYAKYGDIYRDRARKRRESLKAEFRINMLALLENSYCAVCHESDIRVLEFDHIYPAEKKFSISQAVKLGFSWSEVEKEINKCRILCANCHKKHTAGQGDWYKNLV